MPEENSRICAISQQHCNDMRIPDLSEITFDQRRKGDVLGSVNSASTNFVTEGKEEEKQLNHFKSHSTKNDCTSR